MGNSHCYLQINQGLKKVGPCVWDPETNCLIGPNTTTLTGFGKKSVMSVKVDPHQDVKTVRDIERIRVAYGERPKDITVCGNEYTLDLRPDTMAAIIVKLEGDNSNKSYRQLWWFFWIRYC